MPEQVPPLTLPDLGVTVVARPDGTATIELGWFGSRQITKADIEALKAWLVLLEAATL